MFEPIELRTDRLLLRPWRLSDLDDAFTYASDPEWARYLWFTPQPYTRRDAEEFIARAVQDTWAEQAQFAIDLDGHAIGGVRVYVTGPPANTVAGLGYNIGRAHWNKGYVTEAARRVLEYALKTVGLHKVYASADARNLASIRVMQKLGMQQEGILREHRFYRGEWVDEVRFGILASEFH
jgi:ribosomal-protein-alanine N-acetyltransferase